MTSMFIRTACLALAGAVWLASPTPARAQDANRDAALTVSQARDLVDSVDKRTGEFREQFEKALEHSMADGTKFEGRARDRGKDLQETAHKLKEVFHDKKDKNNPAIRDCLDKTLSAAADVNRVMAANRFTDKLQRDWQVLRSDLNALAQIYSLSQI